MGLTVLFPHIFILCINHVITFSLHCFFPFNFVSLSFSSPPASLPPPFISSSIYFTLSFKNNNNTTATKQLVHLFRHLGWFHASLNGETSHVHGLKDLILLKCAHPLLPHCCRCVFTPRLSHLFSHTSWALLLSETLSGSGQIVQCQHCGASLLFQDHYCDVNTLNRMYSGCRASPHKRLVSSQSS